MMTTNNLQLFVQVVKTERKMKRLMCKDTRQHTVKSVAFTLTLLNNKDSYFFLDDISLSVLSRWSSKRVFKLNLMNLN